MWSDEKINLVWHGDKPIDIANTEKTVISDILSSLWGLKNPSDLIFHTVFLSADMDGEHVIVWGEPDDDLHFHCQWYETGETMEINN